MILNMFNQNIRNLISFPSPDILCYDIFYLFNRKSEEKPVSITDYCKNLITFYLNHYKQITKEFIKDCLKFKQESVLISEDKIIKEFLLVVIGTVNHARVFDCFKSYIKYPYKIWGNQGEQGKRNLPLGPNINYIDKIKIINFLLFKEIFTKKTNKKIFYRKRNFIYNQYIQLVQIERILKKSNVRLIVLFNDHVSWYRAVLLAANKLNIKTVYIPHASVTENFPPLLFSYAFLEGKDMEKKYLCKQGNLSKIITIGNCKFDNQKKKKKDMENDSIGIIIGIAYNLLDDVKVVNKIAKVLVNRYYYNDQDEEIKIKKIIIRPHPRSKQIIDIENPIVNFSNSQEETSLDFIEKCSFIISSPSTNLVLESLLLDTPIISFNFSKTQNIIRKVEINDHYGFIQEGLVNFPIQVESVLFEKIKELRESNFMIHPNVKNKLKKYNAAIETQYEGQVSQLIGTAINELINKGDLSRYFISKVNLTKSPD